MKSVKKIIKGAVAKFLFGIGMVCMGLAMKIDKDTIGKFMISLMGVSMKGKQEMEDGGEKTEKGDNNYEQNYE